LLDHAYDNLSFEEIYAALTRKPPAGGGQQQDRAGGPPAPQPAQPGPGPAARHRPAQPRHRQQ
jgi:hypothetical protein